MSASTELALPLTLMPRTHQSRIGIQDVAGVRVAVVEFCNADFDAIHDTGEPAIALARANAITLACNTHPALVSALEKCVRQFEDMDENQPTDAGCIDCNVGTVPNHLNTGRCGYHAAKVALRLARGED